MELRIIRQWPDKIIVSLKEREPRFCFPISQNNFLLLDNNLVELEKIAQACTSDLIKISILNNGQLHLLSEIDDIKLDIINIVELLSEFEKFQIMEISINDPQIMLIIANPISNGFPWVIKFNKIFDLQKQLKHLKLFLENKSIDEISLIDYIDLGSHSERIFYANR